MIDFDEYDNDVNVPNNLIELNKNMDKIWISAQNSQLTFEYSINPLNIWNNSKQIKESATISTQTDAITECDFNDNLAISTIKKVDINSICSIDDNKPHVQFVNIKDVYFFDNNTYIIDEFGRYNVTNSTNLIYNSYETVKINDFSEQIVKINQNELKNYRQSNEPYGLPHKLSLTYT